MSGRFTGVRCEALKRRKEGKMKRRDSEVQQMRYGTKRKRKAQQQGQKTQHRIKIGY